MTGPNRLLLAGTALFVAGVGMFSLYVYKVNHKPGEASAYESKEPLAGFPLLSLAVIGLVLFVIAVLWKIKVRQDAQALASSQQDSSNPNQGVGQ